MDLGFRGVTAIYGRPGVGKTTLAMRMAHERLQRGERVLWVSLYEDRETFFKNASLLGYDLSKVDFWDFVFVKTDVMLNQIVSAVSQEAYGLVVVDSMSSVLEGAQAREYLINAVYRVFKSAGVDLVAISEEESATPLDYVVDNLLRLEMRLADGVTERRMYVVKSRGRQAGYYVEFDILEGRGLVFIDELPKPAPRGSFEAWSDAVSQAVGPIKGGRVYLFLGGALTPLLAKAAADLSKAGLRVLYRVQGKDAEAVRRLVEKFGGRAVVQRAAPRPQSYFAHVMSLYESLNETGADVVVSDSVDLEFLLYGKKALDINLHEVQELRELGVALLIGMNKDRGLRHTADTVVSIRGGEAVAHTPEGRRTCKVELKEKPGILCSST